MKYQLLLIAGLAAVLCLQPAGAQRQSQRTVLKSVSVGSEGGRTISCKDLVSGGLTPKARRVFWSEDSQVVESYPARAVKAPKLPVSMNPEVKYGIVPSRNEFGIDRGWYPSPDGSLLAVYRVDQSAVSEFPLLDIRSRTGSRYIAGVSWTPDGGGVLVQVVDRSQHHVKLQHYRASDGSLVRTLLEEANDAWVEPRDGVRFIQGTDFFIYRTDNRDGYRQLYLCDLQGGIRRLTGCDADVSYVANDGEYVYYTSAEVSPVESHLFRIRLSRLKAGRKPQVLNKIRIGAPQRLTEGSGLHRIRMSPDCRRFIDRWSAVDMPGCTELRSADGKLLELLDESPRPLQDVAPVSVEFGTVPSADPQYVNYYRLIKPAGFDPSKKYPVIVYVYGGPHSQMVTDSWLGGIRYWELLMAQKGYVMYVQDNRGTSNRGAAFEKAINRRCGQAESADQMEGLRQLIAEGWVDEARIGVSGWSYGGFMTITLATSFPETFKVAVCGGPVIDWKWYEIMYGERYMDTPQENPEGYEGNSLLNKAKDLEGRLLVIHGAEDNTVVWQHSLEFIERCINNYKQVDYFVYPHHEHNVRGGERLHLYKKMFDYYEAFLK